MPLYNSQLLAIREMLQDPSQEIRREGYDLLFKLWKVHADSADFILDLMPVAAENEKLIQELRIRLYDLSLSDSITNTFLHKHLNILASEISKHKVAEPVEGAANRIEIPKSGASPDEPKTNIAPWQKALAGTILLTVLVVTGIYLLYVTPTKNNTLTTDLPGLELSYKSPLYLSLHDEIVLEVSVENSMPEEFEGMITLVFDDPEHSIKPARDQNLSRELDIHPNDKELEEFKFVLTRKPINRNLSYHFQLTRTDDSKFKSGSERLLIAPIPYLRTVSTWLFGTLGTLLIASLWDQVRKVWDGTIDKILAQLRRSLTAQQ